MTDDHVPGDDATDTQTGVVDGDIMVADPQGSGDSFLSFLRELPVLLLIAFGLAFLLRMFVVQVFYIPSGSMIPTLEINDRIVVEKLSYLTRDPERGEIIVFAGDEPSSLSQQTSIQKVLRGTGQFLGVVPMDARDFVKRVIGLPGDTVTFDTGVVSVNGVELDEPYADLDSYNGDDEVIPEGFLFVMGDNRDSSSDSRFSLGLIDIDDIVGRAVLVLWPFDHFGSPEGSDHPDIETRPAVPASELEDAQSLAPLVRSA